MDRRRIVFMVVLLSALVWAVTTSPLTKRFFGRTPQRPVSVVGALGPLAEQPGGRVSAPVAAAPATPLSPDELSRWREVHASTWSRDPFFTAAEEHALAAPRAAPPAVKPPPAPLPSYTVKTILISGGEKVATLDGRLVGEGEVIGEERVVEIGPDGVVLERAGERRRLLLPGGTVGIDDAGSSAIRGR